MQNQLLDLIHAQRGHFLFESGHHGDLWLELELLFLEPKRVEPYAAELAKRLAGYRIDAVCGPLVEGAFVGLMTAKFLDVEFFYTEQKTQSPVGGLYPVAYQLPAAQRGRIQGRRVAIVNDVINAGSAVGGAYLDLLHCDAEPIAMATLLTLGETPQRFAQQWKIDLITIGSQPNSLWKPNECPLCAKGLALETR